MKKVFISILIILVTYSGLFAETKSNLNNPRIKIGQVFINQYGIGDIRPFAAYSLGLGAYGHFYLPKDIPVAENIGFSANVIWQNLQPATGAVAVFNSTTLYAGIFYDFLLGTSGFSIQPEIGYGMAVHVFTTTQEALKKTDGVYIDQVINFALRFDYSFPGFSQGNLEIALEPVYTIMPEQNAVVQFLGFKLGLSYGFPISY